MADGGQRRRSWLSQPRVKIALSIALVEGIIVAIDRDLSRWTVIIIAVPIVLFYLLAGRTLESKLGRDASWVAAASQSLAVVVVILTFVIEIFALIIAGVFGAVALYLLYMDKPASRARPTESEQK